MIMVMVIVAVGGRRGIIMIIITITTNLHPSGSESAMQLK